MITLILQGTIGRVLLATMTEGFRLWIFGKLPALLVGATL